MKNKSVKVNLILNCLKTFLTIVFPFITFPYISHILDATSIGKVQFAASIISYFALIASLGISTYAIREGASLRDDKEKLSQFCNQIFSINMIMTIIAYLGIFVLLIFYNRTPEYGILIIIQSLTIIFTTLGVDWVNSIFEDYLYITVRTVIVQVIALILIFTFIKNSGDYYNYALISIFSSVGANILNFFYVRKYVKIKFTLKIDWKKHILPITILFSQAITTTIYNSCDVTMLGVMKTEYVVGIYFVGTKIYTIFKQLINSSSAVIIPRVSNYLKHDMKNEKDKLLNNFLSLIIILILPIVTGIIILNKEIILLVAGENYLESRYSLMILSFALLCSALAYFFANLILIPHKKEKIALKATLIASLTNLVLNFLFIPLFEEKGAAFTTFLAEAIVAFIAFRNAIKLVHFQNFSKTILSSLLGCLVIVLYSYVVRVFNFPLISNIFITIVGSVFFYFIIVFIFNKDWILKIIKNRKLV